MAQAKKITSLKDLKAIKDKVGAETMLRDDGFHVSVCVHMGTCGIASGARDIIDALSEEISASGRRDIRLTTSGCIGTCSHEPAVTVDMIGGDSVLYGDLDRDTVRTVFREHVLEGRIVPQHVITYKKHATDKTGDKQ